MSEGPCLPGYGAVPGKCRRCVRAGILGAAASRGTQPAVSFPWTLFFPWPKDARGLVERRRADHAASFRGAIVAGAWQRAMRCVAASRRWRSWSSPVSLWGSSRSRCSRRRILDARLSGFTFGLRWLTMGAEDRGDIRSFRAGGLVLEGGQLLFELLDARREFCARDHFGLKVQDVG